MTSAADFHILSARNVFGLVAVVVAVLIPVGLKRIFKQELGDLNTAETILSEQHVEDLEIVVPTVHTFGQEVVDEEYGRRYLAVDSGMELAGPSAGDESLDIDVGSVVRKGKGRNVEIFANIIEEDESEDVLLGPKGEKRREVKGYGATDTSRTVRSVGM